MNDPFNELSRLQKDKLSVLLGAHIYKYGKEQEMLPTIKNGNIIGIILDGTAQVIYTEYNGNEILLEELTTNSVFGSNFSPISNENCQIISKENTETLVIDYDKLINPKNLKYSYFNIFFRNLFEIINIKFKETNERIQILERKQIRDKLLEYFEIRYKKSGSRNIYLPFTFRELADYIAVNRSAMFRELKHLKEEGFIEVKNNKITLLYK